MSLLTDWEVIDQSDQGICIFDCHFKIVYVNKKAQKIIGTGDPVLDRQFKCLCGYITKMWEISQNPIQHHSGTVAYSLYNGIGFNCFSFRKAGKIFIWLAFDDNPLLNCPSTGEEIRQAVWTEENQQGN